MTIDTFARMAHTMRKIGLFFWLLIAHGLEPDGVRLWSRVRELQRRGGCHYEPNFW
jgi:hypothetical protein